MDITITEDELPGLFREGDDYVVPLAQVPLAANALRELADKLEAAYDQAD